MARLTPEMRAKLMADYHSGVNKNQLSKKYGISPPSVHKMCNGVKPRNVHTIDTLTRVANDLIHADRYELESINNIVAQRAQDQRAKDIEFFRSASMLISKKAVDMVERTELCMSDVERAQNIISRGKETVYGKQPEIALQVNNNDNKVVYGWEESQYEK
jgi:hypothetical protein